MEVAGVAPLSGLRSHAGRATGAAPTAVDDSAHPRVALWRVALAVLAVWENNRPHVPQRQAMLPVRRRAAVVELGL